MLRIYLSFLGLFLPFAFLAQPTSNPISKNVSTLTIEQIMQGKKFVGYLPNDIRWSEDSRSVYFSWNPEMDTLRSLYKTQLENGGWTGAQQVGIEEQKSIYRGGNYNKDRTKITYSNKGDLFLRDFTTGGLKQITSTLERESGPVFSGNGTAIVFEKDGNLFAWDIADGITRQLTDFKKGFKKNKQVLSEQDEWLKQDQLGMFEILAERKMTKETRERRNKLLEPKRPKTYHYGDKRLSDLAISPDGRFITFRLLDRGEGKRTEVPNYVTESGRVEDINARPKVGSEVDKTELGIYDTEADTVFIVDPLQIEGIYDKPAFLKEYWKGSEEYEEKYSYPRALVFHKTVFSDDGKALISAKAQDNKDRWLFLLDLPTGKLDLLDRQHDDAWVGGPGISGWNFSAGNMGWMPDNGHIWFQSEETGYSHLYVLNIKTKKKKALTKGDFEILDAQLSNDKTTFFHHLQ